MYPRRPAWRPVLRPRSDGSVSQPLQLRRSVIRSDIVEQPAQPRERAGKGPARATRRTGRVPGVIYGAKKDHNLISVEERLLTKLLHQGGFFSILFDLKVDGKAERVLARDATLDPESDKPVHHNFQERKRVEQGKRL